MLWCLGLYLRLGVLIVPPLIPRLESLLGFSAEQVAVAASLPVLFIAAGSLAGGWVTGRLGIFTTVIAGLLVMAVGGALRSVPVGFGVFLLFTLIMGIGIALMQTGLPALARSWVPGKVGRATAVYTNGLLIGEVLAAGLTGPLVSHVLGKRWLWVFALWMIPAVVLAATLLARREPRTTPAARRRSDVATSSRWHNPVLWRLGILLGTAGGLYLSGNIFLPQILADSGRLRLLTPSLVSLNAMQLVSSAALVLLTDRLLGRRWPIAAALIMALAMVPAMLRLPGTGPVWAAGLYGFATSALLTLVMALPPWLVPLPQVPRLAARVFTVGYALVFVLPVLGAWAHDLTGFIAAGFAPAVCAGLLSLIVTEQFQPHNGIEQHMIGKEFD
ncbi:MAG: MFS transporter [Gammaproteobacteria bacterium]|nr:MFS transporter [Gammaproteobacteria bacterium]